MSQYAGFADREQITPIPVKHKGDNTFKGLFAELDALRDPYSLGGRERPFGG